MTIPKNMKILRSLELKNMFKAGAAGSKSVGSFLPILNNAQTLGYGRAAYPGMSAVESRSDPASRSLSLIYET